MSEKTDSTEFAYLPESLIEGKEPTALRVPDDSMAGIVWKDDIVFVEAGEGKDIQDGELCCVHVEKVGRLIRHVFFSPDGPVILVAAKGVPPQVLESAVVGLIQRVTAVNVAGMHLRFGTNGGRIQ